MATFEVQVEGLTGLSIESSGTTPTQAELTEFLKDGVIDVTNRWLETHPMDAQNFQRVQSSDSQGGIDTNGAKVITVIRESGTDGSSDGTTSWKVCQPVSPALQSRVVDPDSLHFASQYNPRYMIDDNSKINVYPVPSENNGYKIYYVNNVPVDKGGASLAYTHSDIGYFADNKVYLVVLYAGIKSLEAKMAEYVIDEEDVELVQAITSNLASLKQQYERIFTPLQPQQQQAGVAQ